MMHIAGLCVAVLVGLLMTFNGILMLASPRLWFRLPDWVGFQGSLRYSTSRSAVEVRFMGAGILAVIALVLYCMAQ